MAEFMDQHAHHVGIGECSDHAPPVAIVEMHVAAESRPARIKRVCFDGAEAVDLMLTDADLRLAIRRIIIFIGGGSDVIQLDEMYWHDAGP